MSSEIGSRQREQLPVATTAAVPVSSTPSTTDSRSRSSSISAPAGTMMTSGTPSAVSRGAVRWKERLSPAWRASSRVSSTQGLRMSTRGGRGGGSFSSGMSPTRIRDHHQRVSALVVVESGAAVATHGGGGPEVVAAGVHRAQRGRQQLGELSQLAVHVRVAFAALTVGLRVSLVDDPRRLGVRGLDDLCLGQQSPLLAARLVDPP